MNHKVDFSCVTFAHRPTSIAGTWVCEAVSNDIAMPIGSVWYRWLGNNHTIEIMQSYVVPWARRQGIRTAIHNHLIEAYPTVKLMITATGTPEALPWLKKMGFEKDAIMDDWKLPIRPKSALGAVVAQSSGKSA